MRNYLFVLASAIVLVLILIGMPGRHSFKLRAGEMLDRVLLQEQIIDPGQFETLMRGGQEAVLIDMSVGGNDFDVPVARYIRMPVSEMNMDNIRKILQNNNTYILYSHNKVSARQTWILLTQMGRDNIKVLEENIAGTDEIPRFTFTPNQY